MTSCVVYVWKDSDILKPRITLSTPIAYWVFRHKSSITFYYMSSVESAIASTSNFISYPSATPLPPTPPPAPPAPTQLLKDRLYVGNLHPTVDECVSDVFRVLQFDMYSVLLSNRYTLLQLFSKHGKVSKLDFLFHKTGPAKGKPRGYAFVEYTTKEVHPPFPPE